MDPTSGEVVGIRRDRGFCHHVPWHVQVNLQILEIKNYNEDGLLLVIPTMTYSK